MSLHGTKLVDRYTAAHYAAGIVLGAARLPWWAALSLAIGWEIVERPLKREFPDLFPQAIQDSWSNMAGDASSMMAGWATWRLFGNR